MITRFGIRPTPRLYVLTPMVSDPATLFEDVAEISRTVDVAAVLLRLPDADERSLINWVKAAAAGMQAAGAALLVDGRPDIVARARRGRAQSDQLGQSGGRGDAGRGCGASRRWSARHRCACRRRRRASLRS